MLRAGDLLAPLVPLADKENDVARLGHPYSMLNRPTPVELDPDAYPLVSGETAEHRVDDRARVFGTGIVGAEDRNVGGGDRCAHRRSLAGVAVAAAAAHDDQLAPRAQASCAHQHAPEALRGMGVVDDREHRPARDSLHTTTCAGQARDRSEDGL